MPPLNEQILLASRPRGAPRLSDFQHAASPLPEPAAGQVLVRNVHLSLDPYMRGRMSAALAYAQPVPVGGVMIGSTVSQVLTSRDARHAAGDWVLGMGGWQSHAVLDADALTALDPAREPLPWALGVLGLPGHAAYQGLLDIGRPRPGETLVVAAASGPVGATVGQIARIKGCRVVGVAGGAEKCRIAVTELGFDACIDHHAPDFAERLAAACPAGIDIYFENVGGAIFAAVMPLLNTGARVPLCGLIAQYDRRSQAGAGPDRLGGWMGLALSRRLTLRGYIVTQDYGPPTAAFLADMRGWLASGELRVLSTHVRGLVAAPQALIDLLHGRHLGKVVVDLDTGAAGNR